MSLITPDFGLFFWMLIAFGILLLILRKAAWGPIINGLKSRENSIAEALARADQAHEEVARLEAKNKEMAAAAQVERAKMVEEAERLREQILAEARDQAQQEAARYLESARQSIRQEEQEMRRTLRADVATIAMEVSERILREKLADSPAQQRHLNKIIDEMLTQKA